jgi:glucose 1-dehydrogenase
LAPPCGANDMLTEGCPNTRCQSRLARVPVELAPLMINVNNIGPGMILTPMNRDAIDNPEKLDKQVQSIPLKRAGPPEGIGRLAVFLASLDADYVTRSTYFIDGGILQS